MSIQSRRRHLAQVGQRPAQQVASLDRDDAASVQRLILAPQWTPVEKLVALYLVMAWADQPHAQRTRVPIDELAAGIGVCEDCITDAVQVLESAGVLEVVSHAAD
jgi:hypothetical protein